MPNTLKKQGYVAYLDILRIAATLSVILVHTAAQNWEAEPVTSSTWQIFNLFNSAGRWCICVFCMISGVLFLDQDRLLEVKKLLGKNLPRLGAAFVFWSGVYVVTPLWEGLPLIDAAAAFVKGHFHLWYLFMIAGLYLAAPVLRLVAAEKKMEEYFLILSFLFTMVLPRGLHLLTCLDLPYALGALAGAAREALDSVDFLFAHSYAFYFVLGHYLHTYPPKWGEWGFCLAEGGYLVTAILSSWYSRKTGTGSVAFYAGSALNVCAMAVGLFLAAQYGFAGKTLGTKTTKFLKAASRLTFGMYLSHALVMDLLWKAGIHTLAFHPAVGVLAVTALVAVCSAAASWVLGKLPVLGKYLV